MADPQKPVRPYELRISIGADSWDEAMRALQDIADHVAEHGVKCDLCSGGPSSGYTVTIAHDPEQTHDRYVEQLTAYLAALKCREAAGA